MRPGGRGWWWGDVIFQQLSGRTGQSDGERQSLGIEAGRAAELGGS